jgi:hypothetical protein
MPPRFKVLKSDGTDFQVPDGCQIQLIRQDPKTITLDPGMYATAGSRGLTLSSLLEEVDPSERDSKGEIIGLDAFDRQLQRCGIVAKSLPDRGIYAGTVERFFQSNTPASSVLFPEFINRIVRMILMAPSIVDQIVGMTRPLVGTDSFKSLRITWDKLDLAKRRVTQGADFPEAKLTWADESSSCYKYGRKIKATYEFMRYISLDMLTTLIQLIITQARVTEGEDACAIAYAASAAYSVNHSGAGNCDPASTAAQTPRSLSYVGWLKFASLFKPYVCDTLVSDIDTLIRFITITKPGIDPMLLFASLSQGPASIKMSLGQNLWTNVTCIAEDTMPANVIMGLTKAYAMERIFVVGGDLVETQKLISNQFEEIVLSEFLNFAVVYPNVIRRLVLN